MSKEEKKKKSGGGGGGGKGKTAKMERKSNDQRQQIASRSNLVTTALAVDGIDATAQDIELIRWETTTKIRADEDEEQSMIKTSFLHRCLSADTRTYWGRRMQMNQMLMFCFAPIFLLLFYNVTLFLQGTYNYSNSEDYKDLLGRKLNLSEIIYLIGKTRAGTVIYCYDEERTFIEPFQNTTRILERIPPGVNVTVTRDDFWKLFQSRDVWGLYGMYQDISNTLLEELSSLTSMSEDEDWSPLLNVFFISSGVEYLSQEYAKTISVYSEGYLTFNMYQELIQSRYLGLQYMEMSLKIGDINFGNKFRDIMNTTTYQRIDEIRGILTEMLRRTFGVKELEEALAEWYVEYSALLDQIFVEYLFVVETMNENMQLRLFYDTQYIQSESALIGGAILIGGLIIVFVWRAYNYLHVYVQNNQKKTVSLKENENRMYALLPKLIADELMMGSEPPAARFPEVTVAMFDIEDFHVKTAEFDCDQMVKFLTRLHVFSTECTKEKDIYLAETTGHSGMMFGGAPVKIKDHALRVLESCFRIADRVAKSEESVVLGDIRLRFGLHTGPIICLVAHGLAVPRYFFFGPTINIGACMLSTGVGGKVHISNTTFVQLLHYADTYEFSEKGIINVAGLGQKKSYWVKRWGQKDVEEMMASGQRHKPPPAE